MNTIFRKLDGARIFCLSLCLLYLVTIRLDNLLYIFCCTPCAIQASLPYLKSFVGLIFEMPKYILMGVGGNLGNIAASYALEIAPSDSTLVFSTSDPDKIPSETRRVWSEKGATLSVASYDDVSSLQRVFVGAEAVTLISKWHWVAAMNKHKMSSPLPNPVVCVESVTLPSWVPITQHRFTKCLSCLETTNSPRHLSVPLGWNTISSVTFIHRQHSQLPRSILEILRRPLVI